MSIATALPNTGIQLPVATRIAAAAGSRSDRRDGGASALILRAPTTVDTNNPDSGMVHLNDCTVSDEPHAPFGGVKNSGFGREGGRFSMEEMTELKWITIQSGQRAFPM
jgi:acyl-CoA reductase-like NAD-dependent aldehyde dehydrogenase